MANTTLPVSPHPGSLLNFSFSLVVGSAALIANCVVLDLIRRVKSLELPGSHLILVLALSDLCNALALLVSSGIRAAGRKELYGVCLQFNFLFSSVSLCAVVSNNFDCHRAIMHPMTYQMVQTRCKDLVAWCFTVALLSCLCAIPVLVPSALGAPSSFLGLPLYFRSFLLALLALSFAAILGLYSRIFREVRWQQVRVNGLQACAQTCTRSRLNHRFFRKLSLISGIFVVTWLPWWSLLFQSCVRSLDEPRSTEMALQLTFLLAQVNSVINPFLYARSPLVKTAFTVNRKQFLLLRVVCCFSRVADQNGPQPPVSLKSGSRLSTLSDTVQPHLVAIKNLPQTSLSNTVTLHPQSNTTPSAFCKAIVER